MNCQRCMKNERAAYRASSDVMAMNVCGACAAEAWGLRLTIEALRERRTKTGASYDHDSTGCLTPLLPSDDATPPQLNDRS
jgi:hypothetical protein